MMTMTIEQALVWIGLALWVTGGALWLIVGVCMVRRQIHWARVRRDLARDSAQRARLHRIMRASDGR